MSTIIMLFYFSKRLDGGGWVGEVFGVANTWEALIRYTAVFFFMRLKYIVANTASLGCLKACMHAQMC